MYNCAILMQWQARENRVEYLMNEEVWVDTCNQNKTVLIGFLLAANKFHCYTYIFKCSSGTIPLVSGSAIWQESEHRE